MASLKTLFLRRNLEYSSEGMCLCSSETLLGPWKRRGWGWEGQQTRVKVWMRHGLLVGKDLPFVGWNSGQVVQYVER